jgi:hypothetical protein
MGLLEDAEKAVEVVTRTSTPAASASVMINWLIGVLGSALNAPNQHEKLQETVRVLTDKGHEFAAAVASEPSEDGTDQPQQA